MRFSPARPALTAVLAVLVVAFLVPTACAEDAELVKLHAILVPMRLERHTDPDRRGATPALTAVKHELRDWIEGQLAAVDDNSDAQAWTAGMNEALRGADLFCRSSKKAAVDRCADKDWDSVGFLSPLDVERRETGRLLIVRTSIGILCGWDESAYVYERREKGWRRIWQTEEMIGSGAGYRPQYIRGIRVSRPDEKTGRRLILSLGHMGWCTSYFYPVYFRLWRVRPADSEAKVLLDQEQPVYLGEHVPPIEGSVGENDALVEFTAPSVDSTIRFYESIRHYKIEDDRVERIDPVALTPRDFVDEWLRGEWGESEKRTTPAGRAALRSWHGSLHGKDFAGRYLGAPQRCNGTPDLWQVGIDVGSTEKSTDNVYFLVRWRPPYHFAMTEVRSKPRGDCTRAGDGAGEIGTLFPTQEWR